MGEYDSKINATGLDYGAMADGIANMREAINAMVAALVADGFSDEQAREIVAGCFASARKGGSNG